MSSTAEEKVNKLRLKWTEFDAAVSVIAVEMRKVRPGSVFGLPRGGLPLAVALSHKLEIPLAVSVLPGTLIVDDIIETGRALSRVVPKGHPPELVWVWVEKELRARPYHVCFNPVRVTPKQTWVVFPWERMEHADKDAASYYESHEGG